MKLQQINRLNALDSQIQLSADKPKRLLALEENRRTLHMKLVATMDERILAVEEKLANLKNEGRRPVLEMRLEGIKRKQELLDMPFEERINACLETEENPDVRLNMQFLLERPVMKTMNLAERISFIESKIDEAESENEKTFFENVLKRMKDRSGGKRLNVEDRILRISTRLQNTNNENIRKQLEKRLTKLQALATKSCTPESRESIRERFRARRQRQRSGKKEMTLAERIEHVKGKLDAASELGDVESLTERLEKMEQQLKNGGANLEQRIQKLEAKIQNTKDEGERTKLERRLKNLRGCKQGRVLQRRMQRVEKRLESCTDPNEIEKVQRRLGALNKAAKKRGIVATPASPSPEVARDVADMDMSA